MQKYRDLKESTYRNLKIDEERGVNKELISMKKTYLDEACEKCEDSIKNLKEAIDNGQIIKNKIDNLKIEVCYAHAFMDLNQEMMK